jgi:glucose-6-phosphate isomerase
MMGQSEVRLYYKNVTADVIGTEHGITEQQFRQLADRIGPLIAKLNQQRKAALTPYRELPFNKQYPQSVKKIAVSLKDRCQNFVVLGIGGSALGSIALQTALNPYMYELDDRVRKGPRFFVFDNVDPEQFSGFLDWLGDKLDKTVFNVISKSGQTAETAAQFLIVRRMLLDRLGPAGCRDHIIATTDPAEGTLRKIADQAGLQSLEVPPGVGGRFSVLSPVGLLGAAVCGIDIDELLAGARDMDEKVSCEDFRENPAAINAAINWHFYNRGKRISVMMPYSYALKDLADWYRQLWAESLGKAYDLQGGLVNIGPTPVKALGATDQHSQVQLYREGPNDKLFTFLQVNQFRSDVEISPPPDSAAELGYLAGAKLSRLLNSEKLATEYALIRSNRPCLTVIFDEITPYAVGQFIYLFEVTVSLAALLFNINAYDQPAVELGKDATFALMRQSGYEQLTAQIESAMGFSPRFFV